MNIEARDGTAVAVRYYGLHCLWGNPRIAGPPGQEPAGFQQPSAIVRDPTTSTATWPINGIRKVTASNLCAGTVDISNFSPPPSPR
jgi:hypothetical protein